MWDTSDTGLPSDLRSATLGLLSFCLLLARLADDIEECESCAAGLSWRTIREENFGGAAKETPLGEVLWGTSEELTDGGEIFWRAPDELFLQ